MLKSSVVFVVFYKKFKKMENIWEFYTVYVIKRKEKSERNIGKVRVRKRAMPRVHTITYATKTLTRKKLLGGGGSVALP